MGGGIKRRWVSHLGEGGIVQDKARNRRKSARKRLEPLAPK
jgi:hypothetical protein